MSQETPVPYEADPDDPCAFFTPEEIAQAIDLEVTNEREAPSKPDGKGHSIPLCLYDTTSPYGSLIVYVDSEISEKDFRKAMNRDPINTQELSDVGDLAFIHAGTGMRMLVDDTAVSVGVQMFDSVENAAIVLRNIGRIAEDRLRRT